MFKGVILIALALVGACSFAQQMGTVVGRTPGSAVGQRLPAVQVPVPKPTCDTPRTQTDPSSSLALPDMIFAREMGELVCLRHKDGRFEQLLNAGPWQAMSADGVYAAYWIPETHQLHAFSTASHSDQVLDTLPGAIMGELRWASSGHVLAYIVRGTDPAGIRVIDLDSGTRHLFSPPASGIVAFPDPEHLVALTWEGVDRITVDTGHRERILAVKEANQALMSQSGRLLGLLMSQPTETTATDDEPDCTGGLYALVVQDVQTRRSVKIPFPKGFESVLDFAFSPDDRSIAVSFGAAACDYPGDVARVYVVSLADLSMKPLTPVDRLAVRVQWSPDGKTIIYADFTQGAWLMAVDVQSGRRYRLTAGDNVYDEFLAWR